MSVDEVFEACKYDPWFLRQIEAIVAEEEKLRRHSLSSHLSPSPRPMAAGPSLSRKGRGENGAASDIPYSLAGEGGDPLRSNGEGEGYFAKNLFRLKAMGFSDARLAELTGTDEASITARRLALGIKPVYKRIDTCAAEFPATTPYMYSTYEAGGTSESEPTGHRKIIILGGGPNRIGQGIEFDYCCVHAAFALSDAGFETIMVNCNPETVSTDYDTSDRLYFEPLTAEDVIALIREEQQNGTLLGVIVQFGGQTPLKLAKSLEDAGIPILGTSPDAIDLAEDRERFQQLLHKLKLRQPENGLARSLEEAVQVAARIGFPVVIRPSYVLGGRAMEIVHDDGGLARYMTNAVRVSGSNPVLIDRYLQDAVEVDVDALADGDDVYIAGIMEHIEEAGIHSGDSACALPPYSLPAGVIVEISRQSAQLAKALRVIGLMNVQFAVKTDNGQHDIYILEVNPRASRTVPFVAKATGIPIAKLAARVMAGERVASLGLKTKTMAHTAVKEAVFPFARFPGVDLILGPEMRSTGEVMGLDRDFGRAFAKSQLGAGVSLPLQGTVFISVKDRDKPMIEPGGAALDRKWALPSSPPRAPRFICRAEG